MTGQLLQMLRHIATDFVFSSAVNKVGNLTHLASFDHSLRDLCFSIGAIPPVFLSIVGIVHPSNSTCNLRVSLRSGFTARQMP